MTGMNQNTIKVKLFRARQKLVKAARRLSRQSQGRPLNRKRAQDPRSGERC